MCRKERKIIKYLTKNKIIFPVVDENGVVERKIIYFVVTSSDKEYNEIKELIKK